MVLRKPLWYGESQVGKLYNDDPGVCTYYACTYVESTKAAALARHTLWKYYNVIRLAVKSSNEVFYWHTAQQKVCYVYVIKLVMEWLSWITGTEWNETALALNWSVLEIIILCRSPLKVRLTMPFLNVFVVVWNIRILRLRQSKRKYCLLIHLHTW